MCVLFFLINSAVEHCFGFNFQTDHHLVRERGTVMKNCLTILGSVVVKALLCYSEGPGIYPRSCHWGFFPKHTTSPCARGRLSL